MDHVIFGALGLKNRELKYQESVAGEEFSNTFELDDLLRLHHLSSLWFTSTAVKNTINIKPCGNLTDSNNKNNNIWAPSLDERLHVFTKHFANIIFLILTTPSVCGR